MTEQETAALLQELALKHPGKHPYTLALYLQGQTGKVITGAQAAKLPTNNPYPDRD